MVISSRVGEGYTITHFADDEGFFYRMQEQRPKDKSKKKKPFYWEIKSKKELRNSGIKI